MTISREINPGTLEMITDIKPGSFIELLKQYKDMYTNNGFEITHILMVICF